MSRNKDIEYLHCLTGWDFKICRLIMKEFKWDLRTVERAYILSLDDRENIENIVASVAEAAAKTFEDLKPAIENALEAFGQLGLWRCATQTESIRPAIETAHQKMMECQKPEVIAAAIDEEIYRLNHCMPKLDSEGINWAEFER